MLHLVAAFIFSFTCQPTIRDGWLCCSTPRAQAQFSLSCPGNNQFPVITGGTNLQCSSPGTTANCPTNALCLQAVGNLQFICCQTVSNTPICPNNGQLQPSVSDFVDCSVNTGVCSFGYQCVTPTNNNNQRVCCSQSTSTTVVCPNNGQPLTDTNGNPRFCVINQANACPVSYTCQNALVPAGSTVCCTSQVNPTCPTGYQPNRNPTGSVIFCDRTITTGCPANSFCLVDSTTGLSLCCQQSTSLTTCPAGQNALLDGNGMAQQCTGPGVPCPAAGYTCTFSTTLSQYFCCGTTVNTNAVCADGRQTFTQLSGVTYQCQPFTTNSGCPFSYDCAASTQAGVYVCCLSGSTTTIVPPTSFNQCPNGWNPYRNSINQAIQYCSSPTDQSCPIGYSCTPSAQVNIFLCCQYSDSPKCPTGTTPEFNGRPRLCTRNVANQCPRGFTCQQSTISSISICCSSQFSNTVLCPDSSSPAIIGTSTQFCPILNTNVGCPSGYVCQLSNTGANVCCLSSFPIVRARQSPSSYSSLPKCPSGVSPAATHRSCSSNADCPPDSNCIQTSCCASPVPSDTRCKARRTLLQDGRPVECLSGSTCTSGYECSFETSNSRGVCCERPEEATALCPDNRAAFLVARTEEPTFCDATAYICPNGQECLKSRDGLRHVCCSPVAQCPTGMGRASGEGYPARCFSSDGCPLGQACVTSTVDDIRVCCNVAYKDEPIKKEDDDWVVIEG